MISTKSGPNSVAGPARQRSTTDEALILRSEFSDLTINRNQTEEKRLQSHYRYLDRASRVVSNDIAQQMTAMVKTLKATRRVSTGSSTDISRSNNRRMSNTQDEDVKLIAVDTPLSPDVGGAKSKVKSTKSHPLDIRLPLPTNLKFRRFSSHDETAGKRFPAICCEAEHSPTPPSEKSEKQLFTPRKRTPGPTNFSTSGYSELV